MKLKEIIQKIQEKRMAKKETKMEIVTTMKSYNETYDYMKYCCRNCRYFDEFYTKYHTYDCHYGYCNYWQDDHEYENICYRFVDYQIFDECPKLTVKVYKDSYALKYLKTERWKYTIIDE